MMDNAAVWFRTRPAIRIYREDSTNQSVGNSVDRNLKFNDNATAGGQYHEEWIEPSGDAATYLPNSGAYGTDVNEGLVFVGDVEPGIWLVGASGAFEPNGSGTRRIRLRRDGTSDVLHSEEAVDPITGRRCSFHACTLIDFTGTEDHFKCEVYQNTSPSVSLDIAVKFQPPRFWGLWLADNATWATDYANHWPASSDGLVDWWVGMRSNQLRIQRRPTASMYRSSSQAISSGVQTQIVFNAEEHDTDGNQNDTTLGHITVAETGWYLVDWGVKCVATSGISNTFSAYLYRNGSTRVATILNAVPDSLTCALNGQTMVALTAGDELSVETILAASYSVGGDRATYLRAHLLSSNSNVAPNRETFGPMPAAADLPTIADLSSDTIPLGLMRLISDLNDRMWHRPVIVLRANEVGSIATLSNDDGWTDLPATEVLTDYTDLQGQGYNLVSGGGFRAPWDGTWLACGYVSYTAQDEDGNNVGNTGYRGCRLVQNGGAGTGSIISKSAKTSTAGWLQRWAEPFVLKEGDTISVQGLVGNMSGDPGLTVNDVQLFVAEIGDGITRDPA